MVTTEPFLERCKAILRREDVREEVKAFFQPVIELVLQELYPYIYLSVLFVIISFLLILATFVVVVKRHSKSSV
jgi:hypothetical protein